MATDRDPDSAPSPGSDGADNIVDAEVIASEDTGESVAPVASPPVAAERLAKNAAAEPRSVWHQPPTGLREWLGVACLVVVADITIYRSHGWAGFAVFLLAAPLLLTFAAPQRKTGAIFWILLGMSTLLAVKMLWCGTALGVAVGLTLIIAIAMALAGQRPYLLELFVYGWQSLPAGLSALLFYGQSLRGVHRPMVRFNWLAAFLPAVALVVFGAFFILANPNLLSALGDNLEIVFTTMQRWMGEFAPSPQEFVFWGAVLWVATGLLRPLIKGPLLGETNRVSQPHSERESRPAPLYSAYRNTLLTVIGLFAIYLAFEFKTLWFRSFPDGFHYSGYAHQGAAWLTVALAVATVVLSLIFRGRLLRDDRLPRLRLLSWLWSAQNLLLALAVYNRLFIYIDFNGMTRMRIVGLFGITAVVIGFLLVIYKISKGRSFLWLVRSQMTALASLVFVFALLPLDALVVSYNVRKILEGDPAPSVQISVHPIRAEGVVLLRPLLECDDPIIRDGVAALLARRQTEAETLAKRRAEFGWSTFQWADRIALRQLQNDADQWSEFHEPRKQVQALDRFRRYAYQWY